MNTATAILLTLGLPASAQSAERKAQPNPTFADSGQSGTNPLFEGTARQVQGLLQGLNPATAAKVRAAAMDLGRNPALHGPEAAAWQAAQDATRRAFGVQMPPEPLEALSTVVAGVALTSLDKASPALALRGRDKASPLLIRVSNVLKTKHDTVKNSINNVR